MFGEDATEQNKKRIEEAKNNNEEEKRPSKLQMREEITSMTGRQQKTMEKIKPINPNPTFKRANGRVVTQIFAFDFTNPIFD